MATPNTQRKPRESRNFHIVVLSKQRDHRDDKDTQISLDIPVQNPTKKASKIKPTKKGIKPTSLIDDLSTLLNQKLSHWALVVEAYANDEEKHSKRFIEICTRHDVETAEDSDESDRYESDEEEGLPEVSGFDHGPDGTRTLGMRCARARKPPRKTNSGKGKRVSDEYTEPKYNVMGGVCWKLLTTLKSKTRFTNSEIRKEAERIWKRQVDYRVMDNNCQRFCILLAIHIRARQSTLLRLLHANTVREQAGKGEKVLGKAVRGFETVGKVFKK